MTFQTPCIGSQLFLNRTTTPGEARDWVRRMAEAKFRLIRLFLIWDHLEPLRGRWTFDTYDAVFDEAEKRGLGVVPTLMSVSPPGWMLRTGGVQAVANLEDEEVLRAGEGYIRQVVSRWRGHPALHSWILWNEASRVPPRTPETLHRYRNWLRRKFDNDPAAMNRLQFRRYESFDAVGETRERGAMDLEFATYAEKVFWLEFSVEELCGHLRRIGDIVRELDSGHPLQVNPHDLSGFVQHAGQSIWREAACVDLLGCSSHPVWHSLRYPRGRWTRSVGVFADLMRAATPHPDGEFWVTELQGGMTRQSAGVPDCPSPAELTRWMWEGIGAGARATVFWCFNWRDEGFEAGEWNLARLDGSPSPRLRAATGVAETLERHADWFGPARPWRPDVVILRSDAAERLAWAEKAGPGDPADPRNPNRVADSASGTALVLADLGIETGYVEESGLETMLRNQPPAVLLVPGLECLEEGTLERLKTFVERGGTLVADAAPGFKDPFGRLARHRFGLWNEVFGGPLLDLESWRCSREPPADAESPVPWWFRVVSDPADASVISRTSGGDPLVWETGRGKGRTLFIGTWFFHRFLIGGYPRTRAWLETLLVPHLPEPPVRLVRPGPGVRLRSLRHPEGVLGVVLSEHGDGALELIPATGGSLQTANTDTGTVEAGKPFALHLDANGIGLFFLKTCC